MLIPAILWNTRDPRHKGLQYPSDQSWQKLASNILNKAVHINWFAKLGYSNKSNKSKYTKKIGPKSKLSFSNNQPSKQAKTLPFMF